MKKVERFFSLGLIAICLTIDSCSQTTTKHSPVLATFEATTPCDEESKALLSIPATHKAVMIKWSLSLLTATTYKLVYTYGMDKQGSRDFSEGAITKEQTGAWTKNKFKSTEIYTLTASNAPSISFLKLNENVLQLLDADKNLLVGNGAWSYTLNRIDPVKLPSNESNSQNLEESIVADSIVFDGRMPCYPPLLALNGKTPIGCNLVKCRIIFFYDSKSHSPSIGFYTIHVGTGGTRYLATGKWITRRGTKRDPNSILYQLQINSGQPQQHLTFLKGDDNVIFLLDDELNFMAGNDYCSFTMNRVRK
jgi:hypothetical protein